MIEAAITLWIWKYNSLIITQNVQNWLWVWEKDRDKEGRHRLMKDCILTFFLAHVVIQYSGPYLFDGKFSARSQLAPPQCTDMATARTFWLSAAWLTASDCNSVWYVGTHLYIIS